jgi:hypothetical protein
MADDKMFTKNKKTDQNNLNFRNEEYNFPDWAQHSPPDISLHDITHTNIPQINYVQNVSFVAIFRV